MDFSYNQGFTTKKAGGIGAVVVAHVLLAGALVYCFQTMTVTKQNDGPVILKPLPPAPVVKPIDPPSPEAHTKIPFYVPPVETIQPPPVDPVIKEFTTIKPEPGVIIHDVGPGGPGIGGGDVKPAATHSSSPPIVNLNDCKPAYPSAALKAEEEGTVRLKLEIGASGQLVGAAVVKSSGYSDLDRAAVKGLSQCAFKAATQDGTPVQSSLVTDYVWSIQ